MLHLRIYGPQSSLTEVGLSLEARGTARGGAEPRLSGAETVVGRGRRQPR